MSSHFREVNQIFADCVGDADYSSNISMHDALPVKQLFRASAIPTSEDADASATAYQERHECDALGNACNEVLAAKGKPRIDGIQDDSEARIAWKFLAAFAKDEAIMQRIATALARVMVHHHYVTARPRQFDMFVHLSASEMFFIDGDSLLMAALAQQQVDWDLMQPLHVLYNAQALLRRLQKRGARFHVVFFERSRWFWSKAPQKLFIRDNLEQTLRAATRSNPANGFVVETFSSFHCAAFAEYVRRCEPEFILMSDGEQLGTPNELQRLFHHTSAEVDEELLRRPYRSLVEDDAHGDKVSFYYRCFLMWATAQRLQVAYSSRIIARENAMVVFAVTVDSTRFARAIALEPVTTPLAAELEYDVELPTISAESLAVAEDDQLSLREQVVAGAVHAFMHHGQPSEQARQLCAAMVITAYATALLPLALRSQRRAIAPEVKEFLDELAPYLLQVLRQRDCLSGRGAEFDLYDGHLLAVLVYHLRQAPAAKLFDEDSTGDIDFSWQAIVNAEDASITAEPLAELPEVTLVAPYTPGDHPRYAHELVEQLAKRFAVGGHHADGPLPAGDLGNANHLSGWVVTSPFDDLNDVVDAYAEAEAQRNLTDRDRKRNLKTEAAFITNASQQAESMGIRGFTTTQLAVVVSDDDDDDTAGEKGTDRKAKHQHAGQRNKKLRSKEDIIREEANVRDANRVVRDWYHQLELLLRTTDLPADRTTMKDRVEGVNVVSAALKRMMASSFGRNFDPGEVIEDADEVPLKLAMWRLLVESSGMREAEFAFALDSKSAASSPTTKKATAKRGAPVENLPAFALIDKIVQENATSPQNWQRLERLRAARSDMTTHDAVSYLSWVYLTNVQTHFQVKLMSRVVRLYLENWKAERERARLAQEQPDIAVGIPLFLYCHHKVLAKVRDVGVCVSSDDLNMVRSALAHFDFDRGYYEKVDRAIARWQGKPVPPLPPTLRPRQKIFQLTPEMMQLVHMGHLLERPVIPQRDYRVVFNPDGWQRELLDIVDNRGSAVVCAPTSAGKTFISYYCMYNALKTSNTKVVVYVAPNRALINQAVADVCARYSSKKYAQPGKNVYGVHGGDDYHRYLDSCQVLVTLPEVLETLLLAPRYRSWVERLDYVILDEIHTMESSGNGDVWERVLALLPCPFIALSATLGETQQLCGWLNRVQDRLKGQVDTTAVRDYEVHNIPSTGSIQRWNDIQKYIYLPPPGYRPQLKKLTGKYEQRYIQDLHPLSILALDQLRQGFPPDITLVPSEVVQLHERMKAQFNERVWPKWQGIPVVQAMHAQLDQLVPEEYFKQENYITQRHARQYEGEVKNAFAYWAYLNTEDDADGLEQLPDADRAAFHEDMVGLCEAILHSFSQHLQEDEARLNAYATEIAAKKEERENSKESSPTSPNAAAGPGNQSDVAYFPDSKEFIGLNMISVLRELSNRDMGPSIVFTFESEDCDDLVKMVVEQLEYAEAVYRTTDEFAQYQATMNRNAAAKEAARKQRESTLKQKKLSVGEDGDVERVDRDVDQDDDGGDEFVVPEVLPEFTFIGRNCTIDPSVIKSTIETSEVQGDSLATRAIKRGIGIHHAGVKGKLRRQMEILFRGRHCGVIFATETLALGVHSPCRSVVLAGDHVLLNTTQFRQMMGRAGRRGLDYIGHLIFLSISMKKITRLMTSGMTVIKGNVQMDPIAQLRLLQLYDHADHRDLKQADAWKARVLALAERLFVNPLFFEGRASVEGGNLEPFSVEYFQMLLDHLQREGLHFRDRPSSLGSLLVDAMTVFRNATVGLGGFAFISMLTRGVFADAGFTGPFAYLNSGVYQGQEGGECNEAVAELLAYVFSFNKMCGLPFEVHSSVLSDPAVVSLWAPRANMRQHRVVLAPLRACVSGKEAVDNKRIFSILSAFYSRLADTLTQPQEDRLPFMSAKTKKKNPIFGSAKDAVIVEQLQRTAVPFSARDPFVAISGCGDHFVNSEDLISTLRTGLYCDRRLLPLLDLTDGCRHDGAQILVNACVADFVRCRAQIDSVRSNYRFTLLEDLNGLSQSESYAVLSHVERLLSNLAGLTRPEDMEPLLVLQRLFPEEADGYFAGAPAVLDFARRLHQLRSQINKDYAGDQLKMRQAESRAKLAEARKQREAAGRN